MLKEMMSVRVTDDTIRSCGCCYAQNYHSNHILNKKVDVIFDIRIGNTVNALCPECLRKLAEDSLAMLDALDTLKGGRCVNG